MEDEKKRLYVANMAIEELMKENKRLKEINEELEQGNTLYYNENQKLEKENRFLKDLLKMTL